MRKIYNYIFAAAAMTAALTACQKEMDSPVNDETPDAVKVVVSLSDDMAKAFTDEGGVQWAVGDQIKFSSGEFFSEALTAEDISEDGYTAEFTFPVKGEGDGADWINKVDRTGWFCSSTTHPTNYTEVEYTLGVDNGNVFTQDVAGEMNRRYLFLHSGTGLTQITADQTPEVKMDIIGAIFRIIPYTQTYNNEKVLSVKLESDTKLVATVAYDRGAGTYSQTDWKAYKNIQVNLGTPFSLEGVTSAEASKGIYMAVAATLPDVPLAGYRYIVETDMATYTFDAMDKSLVVAENMVKNVMLNLDNADDRFAESGLLRYVGGLEAQVTVGADATTGNDGGYWYAETQITGEETWTKRVNAENASYYSNVVFTAVDNATGEPATWVRAVYGGNEGCHWMISADANTGEARSATVTATFPDVKGYVVTDECKTKSMIVNQAAAGSAKKITYYGHIQDQTIDGGAHVDKNIGYYLLEVDGTISREWAVLYPQAVFKCVTVEDFAAGNYDNPVDWITCEMANNNGVIYDAPWWITATENNSGAERKAVIVCLYPEIEGYEFPAEPKSVVITQESNTQIGVELTKTYNEIVPAGGDVIGFGVMSLTVNGEASADIAAAMAQYGVTVSANNGAEVAVAADGSVTMTIPANPYKNGGKEYTVTVKYDGNVLDSETVAQAEGAEEGEEPEVRFEYTIAKLNGNPSGVTWAMNPGQVTAADIKLTNVTLNGEAIDYTDADVLAQVINQALKFSDNVTFGAFTPDASQYGFDVTYANHIDGIAVGFKTTASASGTVARLTWYESDGTESGYWNIFVN